MGSSIIAPLLMAFFIAIVLLPLYRFFGTGRFRKCWPLCCACWYSAGHDCAGGLVFFLANQPPGERFPAARKMLPQHLNTLSAWINQKTNFSTERQLQLINEQSNKLLNYAGGLMSGAAASVTSIFILPVCCPSTFS
jgi:predicted PurR-regulated permease PerM